MSTSPALVVGGGISGLACTVELARAGVQVLVRDRGRRLGGRMASRRLRDTGTRWDGRVVDYGASYFTAKDADFRAQVQQWIDQGLVQEWTDAFAVWETDAMSGVRRGPIRYRAPGGLRTLVEQLARDAVAADDRVSLEFPTEVQSITVQNGRLQVDGADEFDSIAICAPGPQAARMLETQLQLPLVQQIAWEPVIAVWMVFDSRTWSEVDGVFVNGDPILTWIADDGRRRGDDAPVLVAHVHPLHAVHHLQDPQAVIPEAIAAVRRILNIADYPDYAQAHRWSLARPISALPEPFALLTEVDRPELTGLQVGFAGDAFAAGPRIEAAWLSGRALGRALSSVLL
jgi:predicted NAD/FAD-dependent oxidoreductase